MEQLWEHQYLRGRNEEKALPGKREGAQKP
jgi:hypothetical protein